MSKKIKNLDEALYQFPSDGSESKEKILNDIMQRANSPIPRKFLYRKHIMAAVSLCLVIVVIGNFNVIASSINKIINIFWIDENIIMNEVRTNRLNDFIDARISAGLPSVNGVDAVDDGSMEYQILLKPVQTPCYVYLHYYRGYIKALMLDEQTDNIDEVNEWLTNNGGIVAMAAETPEEAAQLLSGSSVSVVPKKIREGMGCKLPDYLPDGRKSGNVIQYNENLSTVNITYFYEGKAGFDTRGEIDNYIALGITDTTTKFSKNLIANLAVTKPIETERINGHEVYISDAYYVWENNGFVYVLYSTFTTHEENIKIIENMR